MSQELEEEKPSRLKTLFQRTWFLMFLIVVVVVGVWQPDPGLWMYANLGTTPFVFGLLFLTGLTLPSKELAQGFNLFRPFLLTLTINYFGLAGLFWLAGYLCFGPDHPFSIGFIVLAAAPTSLASAAVWTSLSGGRTGRAVAMIITSNVLNAIIGPLILFLIIGQYLNIPFWDTVLRLVESIIFPLACGRLVAWMLSKRGVDVAGIKKKTGILSRLLVLSVILMAAGHGASEAADSAISEVVVLVFACFVVHGLAVLLVALGSKIIRLDKEDMIACIYVGGQKTLPVSIYVLTNFFDSEMAAGVLALVAYHAGQLIFDSFLIEYFQARKKTALEENPAPSPS